MKTTTVLPSSKTKIFLKHGINKINDPMKYYVASAVVQTQKNLLLTSITRTLCFDQFTIVDCSCLQILVQKIMDPVDNIRIALPKATQP